jgi:hypothetical protein
MRLRPSTGRRPAIVLVLALAALALAGLAAADNYRIKLTSEGQAAARATILKKADFKVSGWTGGPTKPNLSDSGPLCPSFDPKESDLVLNGAAESDWLNPAGMAVSSLSAVLQTARMVKLDWQRSVNSPQMLPCMSKIMAKSIAKSAQVVSARRTAFPKLTPLTAAFRVTISLSSLAKARMIVDLVFLARGRTELNLIAMGPEAAGPTLHSAEVSMARVVVARIRV